MNWSCSFLSLGISTLLIAPAFCQIAIKAEVLRPELINGEPVRVRLMMTNHSGRDLVLQDQDDLSWLDISLSDGMGQPIPQIVTPKFGPIKLPANKTIGRNLVLDRFYDMSRDGQYRVNVIVHIPGRRDAQISNTAFLTIKTGIPIWSQTVGNPATGHPLKYEVINANSAKNRNLYVRGCDPTNRAAYFCIPLGQWLEFSKPIMQTDHKNNLHILFMTQPTIFIYYTLTPSGTRSKPFFFKRIDGVSPRFLIDPNGNIQVHGASPFDPNKKDDLPDIDLNQRPD